MLKIDNQTMLRPGSPAATSVVFNATHDIENLCSAMLDQANELDTSLDAQVPAALLRAMVMRVQALNSVIMSYTDGDDITLAAGFRELYGREVGDRCLVAAQADQEAMRETMFMEGMALAADFWAAAGDVDADACELAAKYRKRGQPQNNFALSNVMQLLERPALAEGFAAVLSNIAAVNGQVDPAEFARLTYAQIQAAPPKPARSAKRAPAEAITARAQILETV